MKLGEQLEVIEEKTVGVEYSDHGFSVNQKSMAGRKLISQGIYYICPHGRGCSHHEDRVNWCKECEVELDKQLTNIN